MNRESQVTQIKTSSRARVMERADRVVKPSSSCAENRHFPRACQGGSVDVEKNRAPDDSPGAIGVSQHQQITTDVRVALFAKLVIDHEPVAGHRAVIPDIDGVLTLVESVDDGRVEKLLIGRNAGC